MKHKSISVVLTAILLFMILGNSVGCGGGGGGTQYTLTITSTAGGDVTTPAEGAYNYASGAVVNLTATPDGGYRFVDWTATAGSFVNATAAQTTFTMPAQDVTVTAHFALGTLIENVPDTNQPPTTDLNTTILTNYCAPMAMVNVLEYWDNVMNHANAQNVTAGLIPETAAEYLGYFMDTNNSGSPDRNNNPGMPGTHNSDIAPGTWDFVRWDATHAYPVAPDPNAPTRPTGKLGYDWLVGWNCDTNYNLTLSLYKNDIDNGLPMVVTFDFWNPVDKSIAVADPETGETINVFVWGDMTNNSTPPDPVEKWDYNIGHAVTGVGYILDWDPDGAGAIPKFDWVIVHDNWATTPENVAIPWAWWVCLYNINPGGP
ncbi:MAG: hypothetical protein OEV57_04630 [Dehalococcoidia bacterium]|nr:hypothetical protein [Dehalococcoidia bacterium]